MEEMAAVYLREGMRGLEYQLLIVVNLEFVHQVGYHSGDDWCEVVGISQWMMNVKLCVFPFAFENRRSFEFAYLFVFGGELAIEVTTRMTQTTVEGRE